MPIIPVSMWNLPLRRIHILKLKYTLRKNRHVYFVLSKGRIYIDETEINERDGVYLNGLNEIYFDFKITTDYQSSILPSTTFYSRNSIFSGLFPLELYENSQNICLIFLYLKILLVLRYYCY